MRWGRFFAALVVMVGVSAGCGTGTGTGEPAEADETIQIATFVPDGADEMVPMLASGPNLIGRGWVWNPSPMHSSVDGGRTWKPADTPEAEDRWGVNPVLVDDTPFIVGSTASTPFETGPTIWRSTDHGLSYTASGDLTDPGKVGAVTTIVPVGDRLVAFGVIGPDPNRGTAARWESTDQGATWTSVRIEGVDGIDGLAEPPVATSDGTLLAATRAGVIRSTDAGRTWSSTSVTFSGEDGFSGPEPVGDRVFVNTPDGVQMSADGGETWTGTGPVPVVPDGTGDPESSRIRVTGTHDGTLVGVLTSVFNFEKQFDHLVWSDDAQHWRVATLPVRCDPVEGESGADSSILGPVGVGDDTLVAVVNCTGEGDRGGRLVESNDNGRTWNARSVPLPESLSPEEVAFGTPIVLDDDTAVFSVAKNAEQATDLMVQLRTTHR